MRWGGKSPDGRQAGWEARERRQEGDSHLERRHRL